MSINNVNFNLDKGKFGKVDLNQIKGGLKREQLKDKNLLAIFDALDDGNKVLDKKEVDNLKLMLQEYAKDNNLAKREAGKYIKALFGKKSDITKEDLYKFINTINEGSKNVKSSTVGEENGNKVIQIEYKDGSLEKIIPEQGKRILIKDGKTSTYDGEYNLQKEEFFDKSGNSVVAIFEDGKLKKSITTLKDNAGVEISDYEDGRQKSKNIKNNKGTSYFDENNNLTRRVSNDGAQTDFEYAEDGTVTETETRGNVTVKSVKKGDKVLAQQAVEQVGDTTVETFTDDNGNVTKNTLNSEGKRIRQEKTVDGETYTVEYDGNGNTKIIVQNGESIAKIAKVFEVQQADIIELNGDKVKGKGSNKYFLVGEEALIPKELEADDTALRGRKSSDEAKGAYTDIMKARERKRNEELKTQEEVKNRKAITFTCGQKTYDELAKQLFKNEGVNNPSKRQIELRIEDLKKSNPSIKDGELKGKKVTGRVAQHIYDRVLGKQKEVAEINRNIKINKTAKGIAENIYKICDDNAAAADKKEFWAQINQINKNNVISVLDNYDKVLEKHTGDSSLLDTICSEVGASNNNRKKALNRIYNSLEQAAKEAGVSETELKNARKKFSQSLEYEFDKITTVDTKEMDKVVDYLRGVTAASKVIKQSGDKDVSTKEAMKTFLDGEDGLVAHDKNAQKMYKDARDAEGWVAKSGDWVCGLFGCTTIEDMDKKLGKHAADVKRLVEAANKNNETEFKKIYKEVFGIDFNPKAIQARQTAKENFEAAAAFDSSHKAFATLENKTKNMDYNGIRNEIKKSFQYSDSDMDSIIDSYAESKGLSNSSAEDKKYILNQFIKDSKQTYLKEFQKLSKGKTLEQMGQDVDLLTKSAYGTNDIVKDVMKFNENQVMTEMITSAAFEIAGTIALQFVPGLGQVAAARLAVSAAKWGAKGIKIANYASKAQKALSTVSTAMNATKKAKIITSVATTGVATATVNLTNKKSVEDTLRKTLMNMSFAGVGVTSSMLAPKLMKSFGIVDKALANEVAEEIINIAGSYGVTKVAGDNYGETDAFIDFASGLLISRLAHVKTTKPNSGGGMPLKPHTDSDLPGGVKPGDTPEPTVKPESVNPSEPQGAKPGDTPEPTIKPEPVNPSEPQGVKPDGDDVVSKPADEKVEVGPTPENPQKMVFFGNKEVDIIKIETNKKGQKIVHTSDGFKITLDEYDRPIFSQDKDEKIYFTYDNITDKQPSTAKYVNKKGQLTSVTVAKGDGHVITDYAHGVIIENEVSHYIWLSDYPANAVIPDSKTFSKLLEKEIDNCTDMKVLDNLKQDYSLYNSHYGMLDGNLFKKFQIKENEITKVIKSAPHKPQSGLITGTEFEGALQNLNVKKYGKKGLPLKNSHESLMEDLTLNILNKYAKQNELQISDPALKAELEKFIKDVPEFSFMIDKSQNSLHAYPAIKPELIGQELPYGPLETYKPYIYEPSKMDKLLLGTVEVDFNDPALQKLMSELKEGESFAIGCKTTNYNDVKYKIGSYADGVGNHHVIITKKQGQIVIDVHKPASVIKDIPTKINSDPAIAKKIDKLRKQASSISTKMFTINGKQTQFEILHGTQGGSNTGYYVINKETGELFYAKEAAGGNKLQAEMAAAQLYAAAGIDVPEISSFNASDGTNGILSKYVPDLNNLSKPHALANEGFGMDVLLNNWDVVGTGYDNILITADGKRVVRIDAGGSFDYHAKHSGSKPFGAIPTELITLLDSNINSYAANIFGKMSRADMIKSLEKAANIKVGDITTILNNAGVGHYANTLLARRKFIKSFLEELKANPQGSMSTLDYMRKMMNNTFDKSIATAKTKGELEDIKNALQYVIDPKVKAKLQNNIDIKANEIAASTPLPKTLLEVQVQNLLLKNGFTKNYSGDYVLSLDHATKDKIYNDYASQGSYIIKHMETPLSPTDIQNIQTMINEASAYINVNSLDPKRVVLLYNCIKSGGSKSIFGHKKGLMTPAKWAAILNIAQSPQIKPAQLGAFDSYKGSSTSINKGLLALAEGKSISKAVQAQIDEMQAYIGTQIIPDKIVVHRAEGYFGSGNPYGCLHTVTLPNGKTLDQALEEARLAGPSAIAKMEHEINTASTRHVATNNCFTSAFYNELQSQGSGKVVWELEVQKGAKGAFIEGNNFDGSISSECEIILQKDSKFQITSIKWDDSIQRWKVKAKVNN